MIWHNVFLYFTHYVTISHALGNVQCYVCLVMFISIKLFRRWREGHLGQQVGLPLLLHLGVRRPRQRLEVPLPLLQERWRYETPKIAPQIPQIVLQIVTHWKLLTLFKRKSESLKLKEGRSTDEIPFSLFLASPHMSYAF